MTEEQIKQKFKETYPDFMRGDEPLSPYFDIWEYGIEIATKELKAQIEKMKCCENCAFFKDKTYDICHRIKKLGTRKCAFYKMV